MKTISMLCLALLLSAAASCSLTFTAGSGVLSTETRPLDPFHSVVLAGQGSVELIPGADSSAVITVEDNLQALVRVYVTNGVLVVENGNIWPTKPMKYRVTTPTVDSVHLFGTGEIVFTNGFESSSLNAVLTGSGAIRCRGKFGPVTSTLTGNGSISAEGSASSVEFSITGSGTIDASGLSAGDAKLLITGTGDCEAKASGNVEVNITGVGNVTLSGAPASLSQNITGLGSVSIVK